MAYHHEKEKEKVGREVRIIQQRRRNVEKQANAMMFLISFPKSQTQPAHSLPQAPPTGRASPLHDPWLCVFVPKLVVLFFVGNVSKRKTYIK